MTTESDLISSYDTKVAKIFTDLDALHVDLVQMQAIKDQISALGKQVEMNIEAAVTIPINHVPTLHEHIKTVEDLIIMGINKKCTDISGILSAAGVTVYDWQDEFNQRSATR